VLWTKDDRFLFAARLSKPEAHLLGRIIDTASLATREIEHRSRIVGFTPFWLEASSDRLYYRRSNDDSGGGDLWRLDLSSASSRFTLWKKNVLSFAVAADNSVAVMREFDAGRYRTVAVVGADGREELIYRDSPSSIRNVAISRDGKRIVLMAEPFLIFTKKEK
jgi:hypothetical protein